MNSLNAGFLQGVINKLRAHGFMTFRKLTPEEVSELRESEEKAKENGNEAFFKSIYVEFKTIPSVELRSVQLKENVTRLQRFAVATLKRHFSLTHDWQVIIRGFTLNPKMNGIITIPKEFRGKEVTYDGASIPVPWLSSCLTVGVMRPLGVLLTASIVHDFLFKYGVLLVSTQEGEEPVEIKVERHEADLLFREMVKTVNNQPLIAWFAWFFVRLGFVFGIAYTHDRWLGLCPYLHVVFFSLFICLFAAVIHFLGAGFVMACTFMAYVLLCSASTLTMYFNDPRI